MAHSARRPALRMGSTSRSLAMTRSSRGCLRCGSRPAGRRLVVRGLERTGPESAREGPPVD
eukprot:14147448-Alexandrium_andersonii.AAC.1